MLGLVVTIDSDETIARPVIRGGTHEPTSQSENRARMPATPDIYYVLVNTYRSLKASSD